MSEPRAEAIAELLPRSPQKCAEAFGKALLDPVLRQIPHGSVLRDQRARTQKCALPLATGDRRMACRWSNTRLDTRRAERERERVSCFDVLEHAACASGWKDQGGKQGGSDDSPGQQVESCQETHMHTTQVTAQLGLQDICHAYIFSPHHRHCQNLHSAPPSPAAVTL